MSQVNNTIAMTEKSTKALVAAAEILDKSISAQSSTLSELNYEIEVAVNKLNQISKENDETERMAAAELKVRIVENANEVLAQMLMERSLANISRADLDSINEDLNAALESNSDEVTKAVSAAVAKTIASSELVLTKVKSDNAVAVAQKDADLSSKDMTISFLQKQVSSLEMQVTAEREARVSETQARSGAAGVVVNAGKQ